ncbi:MAG: hypothetical protein ACKO9G_03110, partial [Dolichospermum sp.]
MIFSNDSYVNIGDNGVEYENICTNFSGTLVNIAFRLHGYDLLLLETIRGCLKSLTWAIRNHVYTDKTCLRRFQILNFSLVHAGGLCLCSREFIRRKLLRQPLSEVYRRYRPGNCNFILNQ